MGGMRARGRCTGILRSRVVVNDNLSGQYIRSGQKKPGCSCLAFSKTAKDLELNYCSRG